MWTTTCPARILLFRWFTTRRTQWSDSRRHRVFIALVVLESQERRWQLSVSLCECACVLEIVGKTRQTREMASNGQDWSNRSGAYDVIFPVSVSFVECWMDVAVRNWVHSTVRSSIAECWLCWRYGMLMAFKHHWWLLIRTHTESRDTSTPGEFTINKERNTWHVASFWAHDCLSACVVVGWGIA